MIFFQPDKVISTYFFHASLFCAHAELLYLIFQAESTKTGARGKPCGLKSMGKRAYGVTNFRKGRRDTHGHQNGIGLVLDLSPLLGLFNESVAC